MYKAKALLGEKAGEVIYAKDPDLTHDLCRRWKIYCYECTQFLYFNESKDSEKRDNWFSHYDYPDKNCSERNSSDKGKAQQGFSSESREQDLETAESFIEKVFYGIDPEFFQRQNSEEIEDNSSLILSSIKWLQENLQYKCNAWISHYCRKVGFLGWKNPGREISYLMDWLHVLYRRHDVLENLLGYFISIYLSSEFEINAIQAKFGTSSSNQKEEDLIWLIILDRVIGQLSSVARDGVSSTIINTVALRTFIEFKIPPNEKKTPFRGKLKYTLDNKQMSVAVKNLESGDLVEYVCFDKDHTNYFYYIRYGKGNDISDSKSTGFSKDDSLHLHMDDDGDLAVKGFLDRKLAKSVTKGISKVLLNGSAYSMLVFLRKGYISRDVAEKAAQLALRFEFGNLSPPEAFEKFRSLSGIKTR
ncbi:hypothetical protein C7293_05580 [filamentous cyanobacterium CCT1]|nr:hypothetical protein C7293_05580 [filamentous cyanobacterium CCT1]PSN77098.1 hypothetical protein C8B47_23860 [filamentous cyanobacterium CCP4]